MAQIGKTPPASFLAVDGIYFPVPVRITKAPSSKPAEEEECFAAGISHFREGLDLPLKDELD